MTTTVVAASKPFWQSTTFWGGAIAVAGQVVNGLEVAGVLPAGTGGDANTLFSSLAGLVGGIVAIIGRFRAKGPITLTK